MWSLVASGFFAWLDRKAVDMSSQLLVSANPLACNAGPNAHVWTLDPLVVQLLVDVRHSFERMVVSADRACASAEKWRLLFVLYPFLDTRRVEAVSVNADYRLAQDLEAKSHQNARLIY